MGDYNTEGKPLRLHELDIEALAQFLFEKKIRTSQGKLVQPLHDGHKEVINYPARFKVLASGRRWGKCAEATETYIHPNGKKSTYKDLVGQVFETYASDENGQMIVTPAYATDNGKKTVYKIRTKTGLELKRTGNHPLYTGEGWKTVEEGLTTGNRIFVPNQLPHEGTEPKDENLIQLLAYMIVGGDVKEGKHTFTDSDLKRIEKFTNCLDGAYTIENKGDDKSPIFRVVLEKNNSVCSLVEELYSDEETPSYSFIPNWIYTCPNSQIKLFLNCLFDYSGWATGGEFGCELASKELATDVKRLLARLGIVSSVKKKFKVGRWKRSENYTVSINQSSEIIKFSENIGLINQKNTLENILEFSSSVVDSQLNTMPREFCSGFAKKLKNLIPFLEQEKTKFGRVISNQSNNKDKLKYYCEMFSEHFEAEYDIINKDGWWDEIVEITEEGELPTVAITVPKYHNYIVDCLEHNSLIVSLMALAAMFQPSRRVWVVAPDYTLTEKVFRELYNILVTQLKVIKPGKRGGGRARNQKGDYYLETPWGSVLEAKSMENPDALAGEANDLVIIDEAALAPNTDDIWNQMIEPTLMDKEGSAVIISTPRGKSNGFYKLFLLGKKGRDQKEGRLEVIKDAKKGVDDDMRDWASFQRTSYDNPLLGPTPEKSREEIDKIYKRAVYSGKLVKFKQEYLADFESVSDSVFPTFIEAPTELYPSANVVEYNFDPEIGPVYAACDHNFAKPASTIFAQLDRDNNLMVFDEAFTPRTSTYEQAQIILEKERELNNEAKRIWDSRKIEHRERFAVQFDEIVADVSGDQVQLSGRKAWDDFEDVLKQRPVGLKQDRETGCNMIRLWMQFPIWDQHGQPKTHVVNGREEELTFPKLFINRRCTNLIYGLSSATFKKTQGGNLKEDYEETKEGYEGLLDALRYLVVYLFHDKNNHLEITGGF